MRRQLKPEALGPNLGDGTTINILVYHYVIRLFYSHINDQHTTLFTLFVSRLLPLLKWENDQLFVDKDIVKLKETVSINYDNSTLQ